ncbi:MAG: hypothetical protein ABSG45_09680 [Nitrososphaerales archaeon]
MGSEEKQSEHEGSGDKEEPIRLRWRDYLALSIAAVETIAVPLIVLMVVILIIALAASL